MSSAVLEKDFGKGIYISGWFELKMKEIKNNQNVVDILDRNWIKPMTIEGEGL